MGRASQREAALRSPWLGRFARQIVRDMLAHVAIATIAGLSLFIAVDFVETGNIGYIEGTAADVALLELSNLPVVYQQIAIFCALIGASTAMASLARRQELVAFLAAGAGPTALLKPALLAGLVLAALYASVTEWVVPEAQATTARLRRRLGLPVRNTDVLRRGRMWFRGRDRIYRVERLEDPEGRALGGVLMLTVRGGRLVERLDAGRLRYEDGWRAERVLYRRFDGATMTTSVADTLSLDLVEEPADFVRSVGDPDRLPFARLYASTRARERLGQPATLHRLELYRRGMHPLAVAFAILLAAGLTLRLGRRPGLALALGIGTGLGFAAWIVDEVAMTLASTAAIGAEAAAPLMASALGLFAAWAWILAYRRGVRDG
ncbi:MAG: LptF/LptG family permease [Deltaproteobacteria bacterium]